MPPSTAAWMARSEPPSPCGPRLPPTSPGREPMGAVPMPTREIRRALAPRRRRSMTVSNEVRLACMPILRPEEETKAREWVAGRVRPVVLAAARGGDEGARVVRRPRAAGRALCGARTRRNTAGGIRRPRLRCRDGAAVRRPCGARRQRDLPGGGGAGGILALSRRLDPARRTRRGRPLRRASVGLRARLPRRRDRRGGPRGADAERRLADRARGARPRPHARRLRHAHLTALPAGRAAGVPLRPRLGASDGGCDRGERVPAALAGAGRVGGSADRRRRRAAVGWSRAGGGVPPAGPGGLTQLRRPPEPGDTAERAEHERGEPERAAAPDHGDEPAQDHPDADEEPDDASVHETSIGHRRTRNERRWPRTGGRSSTRTRTDPRSRPWYAKAAMPALCGRSSRLRGRSVASLRPWRNTETRRPSPGSRSFTLPRLTRRSSSRRSVPRRRTVRPRASSRRTIRPRTRRSMTTPTRSRTRTCFTPSGRVVRSTSAG